jgi:hypothetical protein
LIEIVAICFIGFEFTTWLLQNIRDIDTREQAVKFGNELIEHHPDTLLALDNLRQ